MGRGRQFDANRIVWTYWPAAQNNPHDARFADGLSICIAIENCREQAQLMVVELPARIAKTGHEHFRTTAELERRIPRQGQEIEATGENILAHRARADLEAFRFQLVMKFLMNEMHLPEIGLRRIGRHPRTMFDRHAHMGVTVDAETFHKVYRWANRLAEGVDRTRADSDDAAIQTPNHCPILD